MWVPRATSWCPTLYQFLSPSLPLPSLQGYPATATAESPICQQHWQSLSPRYGTISWGDQPVTWWQVDYTGTLPAWKGQCSTLLDRYFLRIWTGLPEHSMETTNHGLTECQLSGILCRACFWSRNSPRAKKVPQWAHVYRIHWSYHIPHLPETATLKGQWNGFLRLGDNILQNWGKLLQWAVYALNHSGFSMWCCFFCGQD